MAYIVLRRTPCAPYTHYMVVWEPHVHGKLLHSTLVTWQYSCRVRGSAVTVMRRGGLAAGRIGHFGDAICRFAIGEVMESSNDSRLPTTARGLDGDGALGGLLVQMLVSLGGKRDFFAREGRRDP